MIQTRSARRRAGESADSSDSTASSGRAAASSRSSSSLDSASPRLPSSLPVSPAVVAQLQQQRAGLVGQARGQPGVGLH